MAQALRPLISLGAKRDRGHYNIINEDGTAGTVDELTRVHAGDDSTYITFTYTATQPITDGQIQFVVPSRGLGGVSRKRAIGLPAIPLLTEATLSRLKS